MNSDSSSTAFYLLGFSPLNNGRSVAGQAVSTLPDVPPLMQQLRIENRATQDIVAWYRPVSRQEFEGPLASQNLADLNWLTPRVLAHEAVVSKLSELYPFYPARFGCLFSSLDVLLTYASVNKQVLQSFFVATNQRREWGLKFTVNLDEATQRAATRELTSAGQALSGANYLKQKQLQRTLRKPLLDQLQAGCNQCIETLRNNFQHVVIRPCRSVAQPDRELLLANVALWLTPAEIQQATELSQQWQAACAVGREISLIQTGPWPAYSFCPSLGQAESQRDAA